VTASIFRRYVLHLVEAAKAKFERTPAEKDFVNIPIICDNARIHHSHKLEEICKDPEAAKWFLFEYLPPHSPFLNIVEEVNWDIKLGVWRKNTMPGGTVDFSIMAAK